MVEGITNALNSVYSRINQTPTSEKSEEDEFVEIITKAREEWKNAEDVFHNVSDPDLIDYAIYNVEATKARYMYLLKRAKEMGLRTNFY
ncbi:MAG: YaaL family protein [Clostridiaceae bacterium]|nr:YaaL family protein [Clostridiaceae bacterium]